MALSEHGFISPKRFTNSPSLTIIKVIIWVPKLFKMLKNQNKRFSISLADFGPFFLSTGGSDDMEIAQKLQENDTF